MTTKSRLFSAVLLTATVTLHASFWPNDPYFAPYEAGGFLQPAQWHLDNQFETGPFNAGLDANVAGAWNRGLTGSGVIIGVVDDGLEGDHPDLTPGFYNAYSWGFGKTQAENMADTYRGSPVASGIGEDSHGTTVGGVAAARGGNGIGLTGAAPFAGIASLRFIGAEDPDGRSENAIQAAAILYQGQVDGSGNPDPFTAPTWNSVPVRVKNHSYGPNEAYGVSVDYEMVSDALEQSMAHGVIHVWAAGNQRIDGGGEPWPTADSNKIFENAIPGNIVVAAFSSAGTYSNYSSYGANVFVSAPSSSDDGFDITTTDRVGEFEGDNRDPDNPDAGFDPLGEYDYASDFGGTSSAAPLVSGIMALGVEANGDMNARMAQHLLARTSRVVDPGDDSETGGWVTNAAGHTFNNNYGFGLIDADAFTQMAANVDNLTAQTQHVEEDIVVNQSFATEASNVLSYEYTVTVDPLHKQSLEYILIGFEISGLEDDWNVYTDQQIGTIVGDISAWVTSPSGTRNQLFYDDRALTEYSEEVQEERRTWDDVDLEWFFVSYAYWGEDPDGDWLIELYNGTENALTGTWDTFSFAAGMGDISIVPEPAAYALLFGLSTVLLVVYRRK